MIAFLPRRRTTAVALVIATMTLPLAACSSVDTDKTPSPTTSNNPTAHAAPVGSCDDGFMLIDLGDTDDDAPPLDTSSCDVVSIVGTSGTVVLDEVGTLVIEGTDVTVTVQHVTTVQLAGDHDTVDYAGPAPAVDDQGHDNTVTAAAAPAPK